VPCQPGRGPELTPLACRAAQSILVSGESGAGKTESTRLMLEHLARLSPPDAAAGGVVERIVQCGRVLEAFGNARTVRNDNSSRFGKFMVLRYSTPRPPAAAPLAGQPRGGAAPSIRGATLATYLLERSRVVRQSAGERNFHVFYQLLSGGLCGADSEPGSARPLALSGRPFRMLGTPRARCGDASSESESALAAAAAAEDEADRAAGRRTLQALSAVGLAVAELRELRAVLESVLWLGELEFGELPGEASEVAPHAAPALERASALLGLAPAQLASALCQRAVVAGGERVCVAARAGEALAAAQALAKAIYGWLFDWLVARVNASVAGDAAGAQERDPPRASIGVLDIFGFESLERNGLEQLCINLCNERLQALYNESAVEFAQLEYEAEGLPWLRVECPPRSNVVPALQGRGGAFALLHEESTRPGGSARAFVAKLAKAHGAPASQGAVAADLFDPLSFEVRHYAGAVKYAAGEFLLANEDSLPADARDVLLLAESGLGAAAARFARELAGGAPKHPQGQQLSAGATLTGKFRAQLETLLAAVATTNTHFVRCIKPNASLRPARFDDAFVLPQLRCSGVLEALRVARQGFPERLSHDQAAARWRCLLSPQPRRREASECLQALLAAASESFAFGRTKVFLTTKALCALDRAAAARSEACAVQLQRTARGASARRAARARRDAAARICALGRGATARRAARALRGAAALQALRAAAATVQKCWRGARQRRAYTTLLSAVARLQAAARGHAQRTAHKHALSARARERAETEAAAAAAAADNDRLRKTVQSMEQQIMELLARVRAFESERAPAAEQAELQRLRQENEALRRIASAGDAAPKVKVVRVAHHVEPPPQAAALSGLTAGLALLAGKDKAASASAQQPPKRASVSSYLHMPSQLLSSIGVTTGNPAAAPAAAAPPATAPASLAGAAAASKPGYAAGASNDENSAGAANSSANMRRPQELAQQLKPIASGFVTGLLSSGAHIINSVKDVGTFIIQEIDPEPLQKEHDARRRAEEARRARLPGARVARGAGPLQPRERERELDTVRVAAQPKSE
jgi:myosin-5